MGISASELRRDIYNLLDHVLETGIPLEIERKGRVLRIVPVTPRSKLSRRVRRREYISGDPEDLVHLDWSAEWSP